MSDKQIASAIAGLSGIAAKVFEVVPIAEWWTHLQISVELKRLNINHDFRVVGGCLSSMLDQGLLRKDDLGRWQRREQKNSRQATVVKVVKATVPVVQPSNADSRATEPSPMDNMLAAAASMREAGRHLLAQADSLESACLAQMELEATYKAQMENFEQLRTLLAAISKSGVP